MNNKVHKLPERIPEGDLHPILAFFSEHGSRILSGLAIVILATVILFRWFGDSEEAAQNDFISAANSFQQLKKFNVTDFNSAISNISTILERRPELQAKYDGDIAQILLIMNKPEEAKPYIERTLRRTSQDHTPNFAAFSQNTLLISENNLKPALDETVKLQENLNANQDKNLDFLKAFNTFRLALLQQKNGFIDSSLKTWAQLKTAIIYSKEANGLNNPYNNLGILFNEGQVSLIEYISHIASIDLQNKDQ